LKDRFMVYRTLNPFTEQTTRELSRFTLIDGG
jgi:hypothetical protein